MSLGGSAAGLTAIHFMNLFHTLRRWVGIAILMCALDACSQPIQKIAEYYGGDKSYQCTLPHEGPNWYLDFSSGGLDGIDSDIKVVIANTGDNDIHVENPINGDDKLIRPGETFLVYQGGLQKLIGVVRYINLGLNSREGDIKFTLHMKMKETLKAPVIVRGDIHDGM